MFLALLVGVSVKRFELRCQIHVDLHVGYRIPDFVTPVPTIHSALGSEFRTDGEFILYIVVRP